MSCVMLLVLAAVGSGRGGDAGVPGRCTLQLCCLIPLRTWLVRAALRALPRNLSPKEDQCLGIPELLRRGSQLGNVCRFSVAFDS